MAELPFLRDTAHAAIPIHALRASEWSAWIEDRSEALRRLAAAHDFRGQQGRILLAPATDGAIERVLFGLGESTNPLVMGLLAQNLPAGDYRLAQAPRDFAATTVAVAWGMGAYGYARYKPRKRPMPKLVIPDGADADDVERQTRAVWLARDLVNTPPNDMSPVALQSAIEEVAKRNKAKVDAIVGDDLLTQNYPLIHAVGRAAKEPPRIVKITWGPPTAPLVTVIGKGITFDTGGLDLKPPAGMRNMKKDMGGAAHALALSDMIMDAQLPVRLEAYFAIAENVIDGDAMRPGDVIKSRKGLTVEIDNTDAEGRLVLADALARAGEEKPELIFVFATLTGAARVALGPDLPPFYTDDDALAADLAAASTEVADPIWRMPLWQAYDGDYDSQVADLKNSVDNGFAGSIYGALFLKRFVSIQSWAHFDIFAWSPSEKPARPAGADAQAIRAIWRLLRKRYNKL